MKTLLDSRGKNISIAIIDSGIDASNKIFKNANLTYLNDCIDKEGHGTAVTSIIHSLVPDANLYIYNLFDNGGCVNTDDLINALKYIYSYGYIDIIHLSCGVVACDNISELYEICSQFVNRGSILVAAFDNEGAISYPAAFDNVIGVDITLHSRSGMDYIYLENRAINILGPGCVQRLPWMNATYKYVAGSSFAAPYITSIVAKFLENGIVGLQNIKNALKDKAYQVWQHDIDFNRCMQQPDISSINKAIILPFNKETHSLVAYQSLLPFQIQGVYDVGISKHIGKRVSDILQYTDCSLQIDSENSINWKSDFDTVILGHVNVISSITKRNILAEVLKKCIAFDKNIYCFDSLSEYSSQVQSLAQKGHWAFCPTVDSTDVDPTFMTKLYGITTPVIGVFGTSTKQGKFTLQLALKQKMSEMGYQVGSLGSEPSAFLFGFDFTYPMGYECSVYISGADAIKTLNRFMHEIDQKKDDIIIVGSQSQTIPHNMGNTNFYPIAQYEFLLGTEPDAIILCINPYDEVPYIRKTIDFLQSYINTKVVAFSLYPRQRDFEWSIGGSLSQIIDRNKLESRRSFYYHEFGIPCFILGDDLELENLIEHVTDFFV